MAKVVNCMLCVFYHNKPNQNKKVIVSLGLYGGYILRGKNREIMKQKQSNSSHSYYKGRTLNLLWKSQGRLGYDWDYL